MRTERNIETLGAYSPNAIDAAVNPSTQQWLKNHSLRGFGAEVGLRM